MSTKKRARRLSRRAERSIIRQYRAGACVSVLSKQYGCSYRAIFQVLKAYRVRLRDDLTPVSYDPTPEEIAAATAGIRATWSEADYRSRAGLNRKPVPYEFPEASPDFRGTRIGDI